MRIIQGRDYYDNALAFGQDETIVFVRQKELFLPDKEVIGYDKQMIRADTFHFLDVRANRIISPEYRYQHHYQHKNMSIDVHQIVVLFCGKVYHGVRTHVVTDYRNLDAETLYHWTEEGFRKWMERYGLDLHKIADRLYYYTWGRYREKEPQRVPLSDVFKVTDPPKITTDWMIAQKVVHAIRSNTDRWYEGTHIKPWAVNSDGLKDVQFAKAVDPYAAFQEISMWISMTLTGAGNEMVAIKDDMRAQKHGFDKWSFRKMSGTIK